MLKHYCNSCESEFDSPPKIQLEESPNEEVADNLILIERGQYVCEKCGDIIGEYREFQKKAKLETPSQLDDRKALFFYNMHILQIL